MCCLIILLNLKSYWLCPHNGALLQHVRQKYQWCRFLDWGNTFKDVAAVGIDLALLTVSAILLTDAYRRIHLELSIRDSVKADGIRPDGSFGQHGGILYNGNYGKDYTNAILDVEIEAGGTKFAADATSQGFCRFV